MAKCLNVFVALLMLLSILAISEITTVKGDFCEKMSRTWSGKCSNTKCDKKCIEWEGATHGACHSREGGHSCFCYFECGRKDKNTPPGKLPPPRGEQPAPPGRGQPTTPPGGEQPSPPKGGQGAGGGDGGASGGGQPAPPRGGGGGGGGSSGGQPAPPPGCQNEYVDKLITDALARYKSQLEKMSS